MVKVYYNLTGRGLYSELLNLMLAIVYSEKNNLHLIVNTYHWNSRYRDGWTDYFKPTISSTNQIATAQVHFFGFQYKITPRSFLKNPIQEIRHLLACTINYGFKKYYKCLLTDDILIPMRSRYFVDSIGDIKTWQLKLTDIIKRIYIYNDEIAAIISGYKDIIGIPNNNYIGVHIRRGDKIRSKEMSEINIEQYAIAIKRNAFHSKNIYIATDDVTVVEELRLQLGNEFNIYFNVLLKTDGFDETRFNKKSKKSRFTETILALLDVDILANSSYFIGTYSSNFSRVIPCLREFKNCESIDIEWHPVF
jgi:hypothetical protein